VVHAPSIAPYSHTKTNERVCGLVLKNDISHSQIIDVGAGEGYFAQMLGNYIKQQLHVPPARLMRSCDLFPEHFKYPEIACDKVNLDRSLPYGDNSFDVTCSIEVVEHIENHAAYIRELHRITRPGGRVIVTTPNILNINSRISFFHSGFWLLFGPLSLGCGDCISLDGHITPVSFYYLAATMYRAGFRDVRLHFDRTKKSGLLLGLLFYPLIRLLHHRYLQTLKRKSPAVYAENRRLLADLNSLGMLSSRSVIVEAVK
jgi:SAM-dependent methyltransferase